MSPHGNCQSPVPFKEFGADAAPSVRFTLRHLRTGAWLTETALLDTGSSVTVLPRENLRQEGFPVSKAKRDRLGLRGIGGRSTLFFLENVTAFVLDAERAPHGVHMDRLHFTDGIPGAIVGRDVLRTLNGKVSLDFVAEDGYIEVG